MIAPKNVICQFLEEKHLGVYQPKTEGRRVHFLWCATKLPAIVKGVKQVGMGYLLALGVSCRTNI
jgi:hypothetical protein